MADVDIVFPTTTKMPFEDIATIVANGELEKLLRCKNDQEVYRRYITDMKTKWLSIGDFILYDKFNFDVVTTPEGKNAVIWPPEGDIRLKNNIALRLNDFPYCFQSNVEHYCLWKLNDEVSEADINHAIQELHVNRCFTKYTYYINPPNLKSVLEVQHAHIVIKIEPVNMSFRIQRIKSQAVQLVQSNKKFMMHSAVVFGIFGMPFILRVLYQSQMIRSDANDLVSHFSIAKCLRFYVNYFAPSGLTMLLQYYYPSILRTDR